MTRSIRGSRRAAVLLAGAAATGLLVSGCGTGQIAETAVKEPSVQGVNTGTPDGTYLVRGLVVDFPGGEGYPAGGDAPLSVVLYNDTPDPVTVTVSTDSAREIVLAGAGASPSASPAGPSEPVTPSPSAPASPSGPASPTPADPASPTPTGQVSPSPTETAPAGAPPTVEIPPFGYAQLNRQGGRFLQLVGLNEQLRAGQQVNLIFDFGNGKRVTTPAPVGVPLSPQAPPSPIIERHGGEGGEEGGH
ncbi:hypothetical protein ACIBJE_21920 [Micromonospora sp. NPDC050187]|uniref:hypothetical protein n=1 Tax=Micromonospora sp. NPDC050187 TaxID=3364277 RepID=UPI0037B39FFE